MNRNGIYIIRLEEIVEEGEQLRKATENICNWEHHLAQMTDADNLSFLLKYSLAHPDATYNEMARHLSKTRETIRVYINQ